MKSFAFCLGSLATNVLLALTFTIDFNEHPLCNSTLVGQLSLGKDGVCHTDYRGLAEGVTVRSDGSDDGNLVVFYQFDGISSMAPALGFPDILKLFELGCNPVDEIAASNTPFCVAATYGSLQVLGVEDCCLDSAVRSPFYAFRFVVS